MFRSSLILTIIFIILAGFIIYQNSLSKQDGLLDIDVESIDLISISYGGVSKEIILKKTGSSWFLLDKKIKKLKKKLKKKKYKRKMVKTKTRQKRLKKIKNN